MCGPNPHLDEVESEESNTAEYEGQVWGGIGGIEYTVKGGKLTFTTQGGEDRVSAYHNGSNDLSDAIQAGGLVLLKDNVPSEPEDTNTQIANSLGSQLSTVAPQSSPDSQSSRNDRLNAAEEDTGFKLGQEVEDVETGQTGKIVGFARVNTLDGAPGSTKRKLVVRETMVEEFLLDPDAAELVEA